MAGLKDKNNLVKQGAGEGLGEAREIPGKVELQIPDWDRELLLDVLQDVDEHRAWATRAARGGEEKYFFYDARMPSISRMR